MKITTLEDKTKIHCISSLEAQMIDIHVSGYLNDDILINNGDTIVDVGANIGLFGHRLSQRYKDIKIIALEPIPSIFEVLEENCKLSLNNKYKIFPYGVSDKNESKEIVYYPNSTPMSTFNSELWDNNQLLLAFEGTMNNAPRKWWWTKFIPTFIYPMIIFWLKKDAKNINCELKTLSYIIEDNSLEKIDLLKIDCEGNELKVLNGIDLKHWKIIKQIIIEVHNINDRYHTITNLLKRNGFKLKTFKEESLKNTNLLNIYAAREK